jgi:carbonic anhydrase
MMAAAAAVTATSLLPRTIGASRAAESALTPDSALASLLEGNARHVAGKGSVGGKPASEGTLGNPIAAVLSCADSPMAPEVVFDAAPGELVVIRLAGNVASDAIVPSLEYAVELMKVPLLLVLGHSSCRAVTAAMEATRSDTVLPGQLPQLVDAIRPALDLARATGEPDRLKVAITENVRHTVTGLGVISPIVAAAVENSRIKIVGAVHDLASGKASLV